MSETQFEELMETARRLLGAWETADDLTRANNNINDALRIRMTCGQAWLLKSQVLSCMRDDLAALAAAEMALRYSPDDADSYYTAAAVCSDLHRYDQALAFLDEAFKRVRCEDVWLKEDLFYEKACILEAMQRPDDAVATLAIGLNQCPESTLLRAGMAPLERAKRRLSWTIIDGGAPAD